MPARVMHHRQRTGRSRQLAALTDCRTSTTSSVCRSAGPAPPHPRFSAARPRSHTECRSGLDHRTSQLNLFTVGVGGRARGGLAKLGGIGAERPPTPASAAGIGAGVAGSGPPARDLAAAAFTRGCRTKALLSGAFKTLPSMPQNFLACDREQSFLLPPDVREWLPENHLAWFVIDVVDVIDTAAFYAAYRADGHGRAAYEPSMMLALLLYCWSRATRSSRAIERACVEDVACRVIAAHQQPDHATIARFVERHERALAGLFSEVLALCAEAGLASVGVIAIDGTKVAANANRDRTMTFDQIAHAIVNEQIAADAAEATQHGKRGDDVPPDLETAQGRRGWLRAAAQRLEQQRADDPSPIPRSRGKRLLEGRRRLQEELEVEREANARYEAYRARGRMKDGRRFGRPPNPVSLPDTPRGKVNITDPDSKLVTGCAAGFRATTPRRSATSSTSSSPPKS